MKLNGRKNYNCQLQLCTAASKLELLLLFSEKKHKIKSINTSFNV